jgi:hypothetical protein
MTHLRKFITAAAALVALAVCSPAQAEVITYAFTAQITHDQDSTNVLGVNVGDTVSGTFSFDTDVSATTYGTSSVEVAYRDTGTVETDVVVIDGGSDSYFIDGTTVVDSIYNIDGLEVADSEKNTLVTNLSTGNTVAARYAVESVTFYFGDAAALNSSELPDSLNLDKFDGATYLVKVQLKDGRVAYALGDIKSLSRVGGGTATAVPELSASGTASSIAVLLGGAYVIVHRRRHGAES